MGEFKMVHKSYSSANANKNLDKKKTNMRDKSTIKRLQMYRTRKPDKKEM